MTSLLKILLLHGSFSQIMVSDEPLCPSTGFHPFVDDECGPAFIKCARKADTNQLEGTVYKCPQGYVYWNVSKRCERPKKIPKCQQSKLRRTNSIPTEWINLGKARKLRW